MCPNALGRSFFENGFSREREGTFEVIRTFQQEKVRAKKLLVKVAEALLHGQGRLNYVKVQEELKTLQPNETIPFVHFECIRKAIDAGKREKPHCVAVVLF